MNSTAFFLCTVVGLLSFGWVLARARGPEGMPFLVYTGFYFLTTVIGATLIQFDPRLVEVLVFGRGVSLTAMPSVDPWLYWGLLHFPFLIVAAAGFSLHQLGRPLGRTWVPPTRTPAVGAYVVALVALLSFCTAQMVSKGYSPLPATLFDVTTSYRSAIVQRAEMMAALSPAFYGVIYMGLPTLAYVGLYCAARTRRRSWILLTAAAAVATAWLSVVTVQKAIILVFLVFFGIGVYLLGLIRTRLLVALGAGLFVLLTSMQVAVVGAFGAFQSLVHLVLRVGPAYPYYLGLFPDIHPFYGVDWQGTLFGRALTRPSPDYNLIVSNALYASSPVQGASPIGAVASAYAEGGVGYALAMGGMLGVILVGVSRFGRRALTGPLRFALFLQLLTVAYYLSQVPLQATIWQSYGVKWGLLTLAVLWALDYGVFRFAAAPPPRKSSISSASDLP